MAVYQSEYEEFFRYIMDDVNEKTRIKVSDRLKSLWDNIYYGLTRIWYKLSTPFYRFLIKKGVKRCKLNPLTSSRGSSNACVMSYHYGPTDEQISLSKFSYGIMVDKKFKSRYIAMMNSTSSESYNHLRKDIFNYIYQQKLKSSFWLRIAVLLHLT